MEYDYVELRAMACAMPVALYGYCCGCSNDIYDASNYFSIDKKTLLTCSATNRPDGSTQLEITATFNPQIKCKIPFIYV